MYKHKILEALCKEEDLVLRDLVRDFVDDEIMPVRQRIDGDDDHVVVTQIMQGLVNLGLMKSIFPERYGGSDMHSAVTFGLVLEEIARGDSGIAFALSCCLWPFAPPLALHPGNPASYCKEKLPQLTWGLCPRFLV